MPNYCSNKLLVKNVTADQWQQLAAAVEDGFLQTFCPEPDYKTTPLAMSPSELFHKMIFANSEEEKEQILKNEPTISEDNCRGWRSEHWGTKWEVLGTDVVGDKPATDFEVNFATAWSPISEEVMSAISKQFSGCTVALRFMEPGANFLGVTVARDGLAKMQDADLSDFVDLEDEIDDVLEMDRVCTVQDKWIEELLQEVTAKDLDASQGRQLQALSCS